MNARRARRVALVVATGALAASCGATHRAPSTAATEGPSAVASPLRFDVEAIDRRVDPCGDFYDFACGGWRRAHPIPSDRTRWSRYAELEALNEERVRALVEGAARAPKDAIERRVGDDYAACIDERAIDARGIAPLAPMIARIDASSKWPAAPADVAELVAWLHARAVYVLFDAYVEPDAREPSVSALSIDVGRLGLPDRDDYLATDAKAAALRESYRAYLVTIFRALGSDDPPRDAVRVVAFETGLAKSALSAVQRRQVEAQDHPMTVAELASRFPAIDWARYFDRLGVHPDRINVANPAWLDAVGGALAPTADLDAFRAYARATLARIFAPALPRMVGDAVADFTLRRMRGAKELPPRWKQCLDQVDRDLGDDVGRLFLARYFDDATRARVEAVVARVEGAMRADLTASDWLSPAARDAALAKIARTMVVVGGSRDLDPYDGLAIERADPFGNAERARMHAVARELARLARPTNRDDFFDELPQSLDGFGANRFNAVGFTAGFVQPPVFDPRMDDAVDFGGFGAVVGHELSHRFDDQGRKFDGEGRLRPWWSDADVASYRARAQCFVDEYSAFRTEDGTPLNGELTLGENLADNGGIHLSYEALRPSESGPPIDGFTPAQRFFLAWGQIRCENVTPEAARRQALTDGHSAGRWRVDGVVANMPEFASAFRCSPGARMAPAKRCRLW